MKTYTLSAQIVSQLHTVYPAELGVETATPPTYNSGLGEYTLTAPGAAQFMQDLTSKGGWEDALSEAFLGWRRSHTRISREHVALTFADRGWLTPEEALAWIGGSAIPSKVDTVIGELPIDFQLLARIRCLSEPTVARKSLVLDALIVAFETTEADMDSVFGIEAA